MTAQFEGLNVNGKLALDVFNNVVARRALPLRIHLNQKKYLITEAELLVQVCSQAGAWERVN